MPTDKLADPMAGYFLLQIGSLGSRSSFGPWILIDFLSSILFRVFFSWSLSACNFYVLQLRLFAASERNEPTI